MSFAPLFTYSICNWKVYRIFQGGFFLVEEVGEGLPREDLSMEDFFKGKRKFSKTGVGTRFPSIISRTIRN